jgi:hypothetical protein
MLAIASRPVAAALFLLASHVATFAAEALPNTVEIQVRGSTEMLEGSTIRLPVRTVGVPKTDSGIHVVQTKVDWVSSIRFIDPEGKPCAFLDVNTGSAVFEVKPSGTGTIHVVPRLSRATTNLNVSIAGSQAVRTLVLDSSGESVDALTEVEMDCTTN